MRLTPEEVVVDAKGQKDHAPEASAVITAAPPEERSSPNAPAAVWAGVLLSVAAVVVGAASVYGVFVGTGSGWEDAFQAAPPPMTGFGVTALLGVAASLLMVFGLRSSGSRTAAPSSGSRRWRRLFRVGLAVLVIAIVIAVVAPIAVYSARASDDFTNGVVILVVIGLVGLPLFAVGTLLVVIACIGVITSNARRARLDESDDTGPQGGRSVAI